MSYIYIKLMKMISWQIVGFPQKSEGFNQLLGSNSPFISNRTKEL